MSSLQYPAMRAWKILGLAGIVGVAAVGIAAGTRSANRQRREYREADVDELRERLHQRLRELDGSD